MNSLSTSVFAASLQVDSRFDHWQPALRSQSLRSKPVRLSLHGQELVAWRDRQGLPRVQADRCPHRGMSLSLGKVHNGCLVCPYHGWTFDSAGFATSSGTPKLTLRADVMETLERHGVIWVKGPDARSELPAVVTPGYFPLLFAWADFHAPLELLYDNFTDIEHTGAAHWQFGFITERLDEVRLDCAVRSNSVCARAVGPAKPMPWSGRKLLGVQRGDQLTIEYRTHNHPRHIVFDWWWSDPRTGVERPGKFREVAFFVPIHAGQSRLVSWYSWTLPPGGRLGFNWSGRAVMRALIRYEIGLDRRIIENVSPETDWKHCRLGRFDKPVFQSRCQLSASDDTEHEFPAMAVEESSSAG